MKNWENVTSDSTNLSIVKVYSLDFVQTTYQSKAPIRTKSNQVQEELVPPEIKDMLDKGTIREAIHCKNNFVSHLFLVSQKRGG